MKFVCIGHSTYDITLLMDTYPKENLKYSIKSRVEGKGGGAANSAHLLAYWNQKPQFISVVGCDSYGKKVIKELKHCGIKTDMIEKRNNYNTTISYIIVNRENSSRTIFSYQKDKIDHLNKKTNKIAADIILLDGKFKETAKEIITNNPNSKSILDADKVNDDTKELGHLVDYIICSKRFAEEFSNKKIDYNDINTLIFCYDKLKSYFKNTIIITLDEKGSFTKIDNYELIPSIKVKSIDSTGAGDIFHAAFAYFIGKEYQLRDAIKYSSIAAALKTTKLGITNSLPTLDEVLNHD